MMTKSNNIVNFFYKCLLYQKSRRLIVLSREYDPAAGIGTVFSREKKNLINYKKEATCRYYKQEVFFWGTFGVRFRIPYKKEQILAETQ